MASPKVLYLTYPLVCKEHGKETIRLRYIQSFLSIPKHQDSGIGQRAFPVKVLSFPLSSRIPRDQEDHHPVLQLLTQTRHYNIVSILEHVLQVHR